MAADWKTISDLRAVLRGPHGFALLVIGMDGCSPCDVARHQATSYILAHSEVVLDLYKFDPNGQHPDEAHLFGEEVRYFPTIIGLRDGEIAFKQSGMLRNADPDDVTRIEKGFKRFCDRFD